MHYHQEILILIKKHSGQGTKHTDLDSYLGNTNFRYPITVPLLRKILKEWSLQHKTISGEKLSSLISSLLNGTSSTEKKVGGLLLDYFPAQRTEISPNIYHEWLEHVQGWNEIDSLCQGHFTAEEMFRNWSEWKKLLTQLSKSDAIEKRRAALVLLVTPALTSGDEKLSELSLEIIERTKHEKDILITKAISWLLRCMIKYQRPVVEAYIKEHLISLPKIAVREVTTKLVTGKKQRY